MNKEEFMKKYINKLAFTWQNLNAKIGLQISNPFENQVSLVTDGLTIIRNSLKCLENAKSRLEISFQLKIPRHESRIETIAENNSTSS
jgi:hypothetical protein